MKLGKNNNNKEEKLNKDEQAFREKQRKTRDEWVVAVTLLDLLIREVESQKAKVDPSTGTSSMKDIDDKAKDLLEKLYDSKEVKAIYKDKDRKIELAPVFKELRNIKPTRWDKEAFFSVNLIGAKADMMRTNEQYKELVSKVEQLFKWN